MAEAVLFSAAAIAARIETLADALAPELPADTVFTAVMSGACLFAADLLRALYRRGCDPLFEVLQLESYHDQRVSSGRVRIRADFARPVGGATVVLVDDVFDSGATLTFAANHARAQGASRVLTVALVRKPWPTPREHEPDYVGFDAPAQFLIGYGMDDAGRGRGRPDIIAIDQ